MKVPEHKGGQIVQWHLLTPEELQFWIAVAIQHIKERETIILAMEAADKATLQLIKRR